MALTGTTTKVDGTASRQPRNAYRQVDEETNEEADSSYEDVDEVERDEPGPSQGTAVQSVIIGGLNSQKKKHMVNKKKIKEDYSTTKAELQNNITAFFDAHEDESATTHTAQLQRLSDLLTQKSTIESQMAAKLASLRATYDAHSRELTSVLGARIKALQ